MSTTLNSFLIRGTFGPVCVGLAQQQVISCCGQPTDVSSSRKHQIWKYDSLEIGFRRSDSLFLVDFIGLYFRTTSFDVPRSIVIDGWWPSSLTSLQEFLEQMDSQGIEYREEPILNLEDQPTFRMGIGVIVVFRKQSQAAVLDSMQYLVR